jgi:serine/threonine-protein kinase
MLFNDSAFSEVQIGNIIRGRWNGQAYQVIRPLGKGANGEVCLVHSNGQNYAMKMGSDSHGIALEFRLLKQMQQFAPNTDNSVRELRLGPFVYQLDDFVTANNRNVFYYTMEYIGGIPLSTFISNKGPSQIPVLIVSLLLFLQQLHELGFAFGDIKAENVLVNPFTGDVRLVDFGGVTRFGEGIRQYTEWNDRAYWGAGLRKADPAYDLFAVAMLITQLLGIGQAGAKQRDISEIRQQLHSDKANLPWMALMEKAWRAGYRSASHMRQDMTEVHREIQRQSLAGKSLCAKMHTGLLREWDWSDWTVIGSAAVCLFLFLRLLMVQ